MSRKRRQTSTSTDDTVRLVLGLVVGMGTLGLAAAVTLGSKRAAPGTTAPTSPKSGGVGGPALSVDGSTPLQVGMVSQIPAARGYDTGPLDMTYNPAGWDFAQLGGKW